MEDNQPRAARPIRILIAEDEFLVGALLEESLKLNGYETVGPFTDLASLLETIPRERYDAAVLDVNLGGEMVYPAAAKLKLKGVPLIVLTGYGSANLPSDFRDVKIMAKPYDFNQLDCALQAMVTQEGI